MRHRFFLLLAALPPLAVLAPSRPFNDKDITGSGSASGGKANSSDRTYPAGQDCHYDRDAAARQLPKIDGSANPKEGFDFTALDARGQPTTPSAGATPHSCVRDNLTGLVWEVKTNDGGLRDQDHTYSWYDSVHNYGGNPGLANGGLCFQRGRCDTEKYVADVNATALCGYRDWRMPTVKELGGIVHPGCVAPAIDLTYFPNTSSSHFWSASVVAGSSNAAWSVNFSYGSAYRGDRRFSGRVRLVRGR